jgi:hypothetical protein
MTRGIFYDVEHKIAAENAAQKPSSDEIRQKQSDAMKAFHRKTGKGTLAANRLIAQRRKAKGKP